jgi:hypothetical protein
MAGSNGEGKAGYEAKFADSVRPSAGSPDQLIVMHHPKVIGEALEESVEWSNRLANAENRLRIVPRKERK